jgi:aminoglycoside phosphotransferase (APT) family kinase protein
MSSEIERQIREGLESHGYERASNGLLWETYVGEDVVVQRPPPDDENLYFTDLVPRAAFLLAHAAEHGVRVPELLEYSETEPAYLAVRRVQGPSLSAFVHDAEAEPRLAAIRSAGELFGQIHATDGFDHGQLEPEAYRQTQHDHWRAFAEELLDTTVAYTAGGQFEPIVSDVVDSFDPSVVPEQPRSALLHGDFSADNVLVDGDRRAWAIDFDNALYGDSRYDYIRARDRLTGVDPREETYADLLGEAEHSDERVLAGPDARSAFRAGYEEAHELHIDPELETQYVLLAIAKSARDGEWVRRNRELSTADWVVGLREWYRSRAE